MFGHFPLVLVSGRVLAGGETVYAIPELPKDQVAPEDHLRRVLGTVSPRAQRFLGAVRDPPATWRGHAMAAIAREMTARLCRPEFAQRWSDYDAGRLATAAAEESNASSVFDAVRYADLMVCHQHGHCVIPDISGMVHGLEMRSPFLDHTVLEFAAALPQRDLAPFPYRPRDAKRITKRFLDRLLPPDLVYAPKVGFGYGVSFASQLTGAASAPVREHLLSGRYLDLGIFSREGAQWALAHSVPLTTMLLCFAVWADAYVFGESKSLSPASA